MSNSSQDAGIPMLTEIIPTPQDAQADDIPELPLSSALPPATPQPPRAPTAPPASSLPPSSSSPAFSSSPFASPSVPPLAPTPPAASAAPAEPIDDWLASEWTHLEQKISERTLASLLERLDPLLEQHIRESISASLDEAMDTIRTNLQLSIEQLVRESVAQEILRLDFSRNKKI